MPMPQSFLVKGKVHQFVSLIELYVDLFKGIVDRQVVCSFLVDLFIWHYCQNNLIQ